MAIRAIDSSNSSSLPPQASKLGAAEVEILSIRHELEVAPLALEKRLQRDAERAVLDWRLAQRAAVKSDELCTEQRRAATRARASASSSLRRELSLQKEVGGLRVKATDLATRHEEILAEIELRKLQREEESVEAEQRRLRDSEEAAARSSNSSTDALQRQVDECESLVVMLRRQHSALYTDAKKASADCTMLREFVTKLDARAKLLRDQQLQVASANANEALQKAMVTFERHEKLAAAVRAQHDELAALRMEKKSMVLHLMDGAEQRGQTLLSLRQNAILLHAMKMPPAEADFLQSLLESNRRARADAAQVFLGIDKEREALQEYAAVLSQRLEAAVKRFHQTSMLK